VLLLENTVTLKATDVNGNSSAKLYREEDKLQPVVLTKKHHRSFNAV
jgi:hypothetical protein